VNRWLQGDLDGVDPRAELHLLREVVERAALDGDPGPLLRALAARDPLACAELVAGPRAVARATMVPLALELADRLETVLPPQALYRRLVEVHPLAAPDVAEAAAARHPAAPWLWRLVPGEKPPGQLILRVLAAQDPASAPRAAWAAGCRDAVVARAGEGDRASLRLVVMAAPERAAEAVSSALDAGCPHDLVAWIAAWYGPEVLTLLAGVPDRLKTEEGRQRWGRLSA
jgi:hypothetical protein